MHPDQGGSKKKVRNFSEDLFGFECPVEDGSRALELFETIFA
jgi:hypothetical protein